jgi:hypothetical protein
MGVPAYVDTPAPPKQLELIGITSPCPACTGIRSYATAVPLVLLVTLGMVLRNCDFLELIRLVCGVVK